MPKRWRANPSRPVPPTLQADQERVDRCIYELMVALQVQMQNMHAALSEAVLASRFEDGVIAQEMAKEIAKLRRANRQWAGMARKGEGSPARS